MVEHLLPLAQVVIPESQDQVSHWAPFRELPLGSSVYVSACLSVSLMNKEIKSKIKKKEGKNKWHLLPQCVEQATSDLRVMCSSPILGIESTLKKEKKKREREKRASFLP